MKDELSYIDNITGEKLRSYVLIPKTNWETFNANFKTTYKSNGFFSNIGGFFTTRFFAVSTVVLLSILTAGIFYTQNNTRGEIGLKGTTLFNQNYSKSNSMTLSPGDNIDDSTRQSKTDDLSVIDEGDVIINVEIPVHKTIVINKEIVIPDTIHHTDSVRKK